MVVGEGSKEVPVIGFVEKEFPLRLERTLSRRFITKPLSLLLVQVNLGPLKSRSSKL